MNELKLLLLDMGYNPEESHITSKGQVMRISEMTTEHLINCIRCCKDGTYEPKAYWDSRLPKFAAELMKWVN